MLRAAIVVPLFVLASVSPVGMTATPASVVRLCRSSALLRAACPRRLPYVARLSSEHAFDVVSLCRAGRPGCLGLHWDVDDVVWGRRRGTLALAPSFPAGGEQGDHLIFRWRRGAIDYAIGLHAWEPFTLAAATLRAIVESD